MNAMKKDPGKVNCAHNRKTTSEIEVERKKGNGEKGDINMKKFEKES